MIIAIKVYKHMHIYIYYIYIQIYIHIYIHIYQLLGDSDGKESAWNAGDPGLILGLGKSEEENGNPLQYSCLENSMDRGTWEATYSAGGHKELDSTERLTLLL